MSDKSGKGSILFKLLIIIFAAGLVAVILIPGQIWKQESNEKMISENNMSSIYEALRFYHRITNKYTTDPKEILSVVRGDSSILLQQKVVNHTEQLTSLIDGYLKNKYVASLIGIYDNVDLIISDLNENKFHFETVGEYFKNESEAIVMDLSKFKASVPYEQFQNAAVFIDSLTELRRDLSDYSLQAGSSKATAITDTLRTLLKNVDIKDLQLAWQPVSQRLDEFITRMRRSDELTALTSVGDRVKDFKEKVSSSFERLNTINIDENISFCTKLNEELKNLYDVFLRDFIATSKPALYKLSIADSLIIHLTEENFYSPVTGEMYKIILSDDSSSIRVESPVLVSEIKEKIAPIAKEIKTLPNMPIFDAFFDTLQSIKNKAEFTRKAIKRNTDIFIKYKEIEEVVGKFSDISVGTAYLNLKKFATEAPNEESYSLIKDQLESAFDGGRIFYQAYNENIFGNLDSLQRDLKNKMEEFNSLIDEVKRLPEEVKKYDVEFAEIDNLIEQMKKTNIAPQMNKINQEMEKTLVFVAEGFEKSVYLIFNKKIKNLGFIYKDKKSWEEEKS